MLKESAEGVIFYVKVVPKSKKNEIIGWENDEMKIKIAAQPEKGKANEELIHFLAKTLKIAKSQIVIVQGETNQHKRILIKYIKIHELQKLSFFAS